VDNAISLARAKSCIGPKNLRRNLRISVAALKAILTHIENLDRLRQPKARRISVHYGPCAPAALHTDPQDLRLTQSNDTIEGHFLEGVALLERFIARCRIEAEILREADPAELLPTGYSRYFGWDRRTWEEDYMSLAIFLTQQVAKLRTRLAARQKSGHQQIVVHYTGKVPASKKTKKKTTRSPSSPTRAPQDNVLEDDPPPFLLGKHVKLAKRETLQ